MVNVRALLVKILTSIKDIQTFITEDTTNNVLWSGAWYMNESQTANLSQKVSEQKHGIVLIWSAYSSGQAQNSDWVHQFVPKLHVKNHPGAGVEIIMANGSMTRVGAKYVYVNDQSIAGNSNNSTTGTNSGITRANNYWVLRYVIGV